MTQLRTKRRHHRVAGVLWLCAGTGAAQTNTSSVNPAATTQATTTGSRPGAKSQPPETRAAPAERSTKTSTLQTDLITPFFTTYYLEGNIAVSKDFALLVNTSYLLLEDGDWSIQAATLGVGVSYYFQGQAPRRWYVEAVGEANLSSWRHKPSERVAPLTLGATAVSVAGYRFIFDGGFVVDTALGALVLHLPGARATTDAGAVTSKTITRLIPAAKLNIGWAF